jgi:hypothetical protein
MNRYRVWLRSVPGFYEQYDGYVDVVAEDTEDAKRVALRKLKQTSFPDRNASMWRVERVEMR